MRDLECSRHFPTKGITFTLYLSTKTLQVQGTDQKEVKCRMKSYISNDQDLVDGSEHEPDPSNGDVTMLSTAVRQAKSVMRHSKSVTSITINI